MTTQIQDFILNTCQEAFNFMHPYLSNYEKFSQSLSRQVQVKTNQNIQYSFDVELDKLIKSQLKKHNISGNIFSEESGFFSFGKPKYRVVYDPFCNSSLATRAFHEAALGISVFDYDYSFITSAIMDYQTGILAIAGNGKTSFIQTQSNKELELNSSKTTKLEDAWMVFTLENQLERQTLDKITALLKKPKRLIISSGHIYWLKLATGQIDVYLDPFGGERLYEMFACTVAQNAGCIVTDKKGKHFNPSEQLKIFESNPNTIYYPLAASTNSLHSKLLANLN